MLHDCPYHHVGVVAAHVVHSQEHALAVLVPVSLFQVTLSREENNVHWDRDVFVRF